MNASILIADDEAVQREMLGGYLEKKGHTIHLAASGVEALDIIGSASVDILISDQKMPGMTGIELAETVYERHPNVAVLVITAFGSIENAVDAMKHGVEDYLTKPVNLEELDVLIDRILNRQALIRENVRLKDELKKKPDVKGIVYISGEMENVMSKAARAAETSATVLVTGESGTGKELVARALHELSDREGNAFVAVNCAAIPENLMESELFGHEKGSFTGADRRRIGRFEQADGGTLFLDEIGEVPASVQVKLLRVLQERIFDRVGGIDPIRTNARIIAATNRNLDEEVRNGTFREDLFYRLNVITIEIPPLRNRRADIPVLAEHFIRYFAELHGKEIRGIVPEALDQMVKYSFPGNVRELSNIIEQAVVLSRGDALVMGDLPVRITGRDEHVPVSGGLEEQIAVLERESLERAMDEAYGNKSAAARILGISERKMRYLLKKHNIRN